MLCAFETTVWSLIWICLINIETTILNLNGNVYYLDNNIEPYLKICTINTMVLNLLGNMYY